LPLPGTRPRARSHGRGTVASKENAMRLHAAIFVVSGALVVPVYAASEATPDMKGTWVPTSVDNGVIYGESEHYPQSKKDTVYFMQGASKVALAIDQQEGRRFAGKLSSASSSELTIGVLSPDLKSGVMVAHEGQHTFTLIGKDRMNKCYTQSGPHLVANCGTWERKK
jgi:hypothetical protein